MDKSGLVSPEDLIEVCGGLRQGAAQFDFLRQQGLRPFPGRDGHPRITWEAVTAAMSAKEVKSDLNWNALAKVG